MNNDSEGSPYSQTQGLGHALRTPLNHILGYSDLLQDELRSRGSADLIPDLEKISNAGKELLSLIEANADSFTPAVPVIHEAIELDAPVDTLAYLTQFKPPEPIEHGNILVVDDIAMNREVLRRLLEKRGYTVTEAAGGEEALLLLQAQSFDLMLLDILMPEVTGWEVLQRARRDFPIQKLPIVMISAVDEQDAVVRCLELGADDYIIKPFEPAILKARVTARLDAKRSRDRETILFEELAEKYRRLQELEAERDDLTHMIVHDLRTPLTSIIAALKSITLEEDAACHEFIAIADASAANLLRMINNLLDLSKLESGSMNLSQTDIDVQSIAEKASQDIRLLAKDKGIKVEIQVPAGQTIQADEDLLHRVLVNLLGNAIKFTPEGGQVLLTSVQEGENLNISVTDSGPGIPDGMKEKVFEKFAQVGNARTDRKTSTGLGLTFCKRVVDAHNGQIGVRDNPAGGAVFNVMLPDPGAQQVNALIPEPTAQLL